MKIAILPIVIGEVQLLTGIGLFRKHRLAGRHMFLWIIISFGIIISGFLIPTKLITVISNFFGIYNNTTFFFTMSIIFLLIINLNSVIKLSEQEKRITRITQELALITVQSETD